MWYNQENRQNIKCDKMYNCYLEINLKRLEQNIKSIKKQYKEPVKVMCVLKANAYGHGVEEISKFLDGSDLAAMFAVASAGEAMKLKNIGIQKPVLVLSGIAQEYIEPLISKQVRLTVYDMDYALAIQEAAKKLNTKALVHVKIDTGMNRIGFRVQSGLVSDQLKRISSMDHIKIEGIFSHFANSDEPDSTYQKEQYDQFLNILKQCNECGIKYDIAHISNSAASISSPFYETDMIRPGIAMYGYNPFGKKRFEEPDIKPCASMYARINHIKTVPAGSYISYGLRYKTSKESVIATVAAGYADGFPRFLTNKYEVKIKNRYAPVCGTVCMDQFMIDITGIEQVKVGDYVMLFGDDPTGKCTVDTIAEKGNTIVYEILCNINNRVRRIYK